ncbi:MAG TPA: hypothetical protein VHH88_00550 [Verrucomicrobiae bacterium]|nr:hypothetical protein [Verrucomicrobiae bacterium]
MKKENPAKHFIAAFLIAVVLYVISYSFIEHRRVRNGPWRITFTTNSAAAPELIINQPKLGLTNIQLVFEGETAGPGEGLPQTHAFATPKPVPYSVPFGQCVFMDSTFLPGTLTFDMFHHEIELIPRVLTIDQKEHPWKAGETVLLPHVSAAKPAH